MTTLHQENTKNNFDIGTPSLKYLMKKLKNIHICGEMEDNSPQKNIHQKMI